MIEKHRNADGTYNGVGVMADLSGLSRQSVQDIWSAVQANHKKLETCARHDFAPAAAATATTPAGRKRVCRNCGGEADVNSVIWYERGLLHAAAA